jgi:NTE family protein
MTKVPDGQRALVLQGGGSLGAYEAGAYQAIYERIFHSRHRYEPKIKNPLSRIILSTTY